MQSALKLLFFVVLQTLLSCTPNTEGPQVFGEMSPNVSLCERSVSERDIQRSLEHIDSSGHWELENTHSYSGNVLLIQGRINSCTTRIEFNDPITAVSVFTPHLDGRLEPQHEERFASQSDRFLENCTQIEEEFEWLNRRNPISGTIFESVPDCIYLVRSMTSHLTVRAGEKTYRVSSVDRLVAIEEG